MRAAALAAILALVATPALAANWQCVGQAEAESGAQVHALLVVNDAGERLDGLIAWNPPVKISDGLPFTTDLIYGLGNLETGTFFGMGQIRINVTTTLSPPPALSMRAAISTPTSNTRIARPWPAYDEAVESGQDGPISGVLSFSMGDGSDAIFYAVEDGDEELTVDLVGGPAIIARRFYDLTATVERDSLAEEAFGAASALADQPTAGCTAMG